MWVGVLSLSGVTYPSGNADRRKGYNGHGAEEKGLGQWYKFRSYHQHTDGTRAVRLGKTTERLSTDKQKRCELKHKGSPKFRSWEEANSSNNKLAKGLECMASDTER